jgi:hypothetical protein
VSPLNVFSHSSKKQHIVNAFGVAIGHIDKCGARLITVEMFAIAAKTLAARVSVAFVCAVAFSRFALAPRLFTRYVSALFLTTLVFVRLANSRIRFDILVA